MAILSERIVAVLLRIPPLLVLDQLLQFGAFALLKPYVSLTMETAGATAAAANQTASVDLMLNWQSSDTAATAAAATTTTTAAAAQHYLQMPANSTFESWLLNLSLNFELCYELFVNFFSQTIFGGEFIFLVYLPFLNIMFTIFGCSLCLFICFLDTVYLWNLYSYVVSGAAVWLSYALHTFYLREVTKEPPNAIINELRPNVNFVCLQMIIGCVFCYNLQEQFPSGTVERWQQQRQRQQQQQQRRRHPAQNSLVVALGVPLLFVVPNIVTVLTGDLSNYSISIHVLFAFLVAILITLFLRTFRSVHDSIQEFLVEKINHFNDFGLISFFEHEWNRLQVPTILRMFWFIKMAQSLAIYVSQNEAELGVKLGEFVLSQSCRNIMMIIGLSALIGHFFYLIYEVIRVVLSADDIDDTISTSMAILNFVLSLQTGLAELDDDKRIRRLLKNFCLLLMAFVHCLHSIVNHTLLALSVPYKPFFWKHFRALTVALSVIIFPTIFLCVLYHFNDFSTWLVALFAFGIECMVKYAISVVIYVLYLMDSRSEEVWEQLDDYIYYIHSFGGILNFIFGVLLFFNGLWILLFERGSVIRAFLMAVHVYQNIWREAQTGWLNFRKRKTAFRKVDSLNDASHEQLEQLNDVCSICFQEMLTAKITKCNHFFHLACLKKWLYVQDHCPLCHEILHALTVD